MESKGLWLAGSRWECRGGEMGFLGDGRSVVGKIANLVMEYESHRNRN